MGWRLASATLLASVALAGLLFVSPPAASALSGDRSWEMVSPIEKNGGEIPAPGGVFGGGVFQAAAAGGAITYSSAASFAGEPQSAPPGSQYISARDGAGWSTANVNVPIVSGSYGLDPDGVPYQLFSPDLGRALLLNGVPCSGPGASCPVANPPLPGTDAAPGYQNYYLSVGGGFEALIGANDVANSAVPPADFEVRLAGAAPDLDQVVLETCAALTPDATEVPLAEGCDPAQTNLYRWSAGALSLVNATPGAHLPAQTGAISNGGARIYFNDSKGDLYLREGAVIKGAFVGAEASGPVRLVGASDDGSVAYLFLPGAGAVVEYSTATEAFRLLTSISAVEGVLGVAAEKSRFYYVGKDGLYMWTNGINTKIAATADASNYPPTTGTARVSADGNRLLFVSTVSLTAYNNLDQKTGLPDAQVYAFSAGTQTLRCVSCRSNGTRPLGASSIPPAYANGKGVGVTSSYKPRALSADGNHVVFDSRDNLVPADVNNAPDVYEWVPPATKGCFKTNGCVELISSGRVSEAATFVDASASGDDVFFVTAGSLVPSDPGALDLYDARVGGGFPQPESPIACEGDACQDLPSEKVDPALNTVVAGLGNPKERYFKYRRRESCKGPVAKRTTKCKKRAQRKAKQKAKKRAKNRGRDGSQ